MSKQTVRSLQDKQNVESQFLVTEKMSVLVKMADLL